jgi:hypothetical protein
MSQQDTIEAIATMISTAKDILKSAKKMSDDNGLCFNIQDLYESVTNEYVDWYSSSMDC